VRLIDACFVWTEPHSKRIKVKLTIQKEVLGGAILQQVFVVEFVVHNQMCDDCRRIENKDFWRSVVQVRQKCDHKKTLFYLEQLVLKHKAHVNTTGIKPMHGGLDFYYAQRQDAWKLVDFLCAALPCRYNHAQELISHDTKNNTYDYKHNYSVEIVPVCKDNIVCLSKKCAQSLGNIGRLCVCYRVSNAIHLIDPNTAQVAEVSSPVYWRDPFYSLCHQKRLSEYTVIDVDESGEDNYVPGGHGRLSKKHSVAQVLVAKTNELGQEGREIWTKSHLGHLLKPGDSVLGFDLTNANVNNDHYDDVVRSGKEIPDVILVKKIYDKQIRRKRRNWKLKRLADNAMDTESVENDFNEFLDDLEEDPAYRQHINIYKDKSKPLPIEVVRKETEDEEIPQISLQEMLDELNLSDAEMADEDQG
uniref:60S ribosomal export protein NMD3 n=1 Tax=Romanomermis culicivorax TaxID=13658 RepID=A0A915JKI9_ROMCU